MATTRDVWHLVMKDMENRRKLGVVLYGKPVVPDDAAEDWLQHLYEELLDSCVYVRAEIERRKAPAAGG